MEKTAAQPQTASAELPRHRGAKAQEKACAMVCVFLACGKVLGNPDHFYGKHDMKKQVDKERFCA